MRRIVRVASAMFAVTCALAWLGKPEAAALPQRPNPVHGLQAEYMARSGVQLTRILLASERAARLLVVPTYEALERRPSQLPVWTLANEALEPVRYGPDGASFEVLASPQNGKIRVNRPLFGDADETTLHMALQLYAQLGGFRVYANPQDDPFVRDDLAGGRSREEVIGAIIDWWDQDDARTVFDPGGRQLMSEGSESALFDQGDDPHPVKNAPFDSLHELRLIPGIGESFWRQFVRPEPDDPRADLVTVYGSGAIHVNQASPEVLLARVCAVLSARMIPMCTEPLQAATFVQLLQVARAMTLAPWFSSPFDFVEFLQGQGEPGRDLYPTLVAELGENHELLFEPLELNEDEQRGLRESFVTSAAVFAVRATGLSGSARVHATAVVNMHDRWTPAAPNEGTAPRDGVLWHYRLEQP